MKASEKVRIFLCGDVMIGRGIDQIMARPCDPALHESYVTSALDYVYLAEAANGGIPRHVPPAYIWGRAIDEFNRCGPDLRIINLETSITRSESYASKGINYRVSPENADCLSAAGIDCCVLANNHVLDWGKQGLLDTLRRLAELDIETAGAGRDLSEARRPAIIGLGKARVLVFSYASPTSGVPRAWAARSDRPGISLLADLTERNAALLAEEIAAIRRPNDIVIVSIHWGSNWGYEIPDEQRRFAHALIDSGTVSIVHAHSAHHAKAIEVYRSRLILYGCGDFLNDYEGIEGYEAFRDDLGLMYFCDLDATCGDLQGLEIVPLRIRHFRLEPASPEDVAWVQRTLSRECAGFGASLAIQSGATLTLSWKEGEQSDPQKADVRSL